MDNNLCNIPLDRSKSAWVSKSGTIRMGVVTWASFCSNNTANTSDADVAIDMTYAPNASKLFAMVANVNNTSRHMSVHSGAVKKCDHRNNGRSDFNSFVIHSIRRPSHHSV